jgi:hypothetical protein
MKVQNILKLKIVVLEGYHMMFQYEYTLQSVLKHVTLHTLILSLW